MSFDFLDRRRSERFAELLDEPGRGGRRQHTRGPADEGLAELVAIGHRLSAPRPAVAVDPEFRVGLRAMLMATAERDGIGVTAPDPDAEHVGGHAAVREPRRGIGATLLGRGSGRRIRARGAIVIGVAAGAMAVSGISAASENAAPGDALYGVKRSTERAQLAMAGSDITRGQLSLDFARTRLAEAASLSRSADFAGVLEDMDADTRQGLKLLNESAVARKDATPLNRVDAFVAAQRQTFAPITASAGEANRLRADESLELLEDAQNRADSLRAGLACDTVERDGADSIGPKLRSCLTGTDNSSSDEEPSTGQGQKADQKNSKPAGNEDEVSPERTGPAADPAKTDEPSDQETPGRNTGDRSPATPTPGASTPADPGSEEEPGLLEGLLGGIFG